MPRSTTAYQLDYYSATALDVAQPDLSDPAQTLVETRPRLRALPGKGLDSETAPVSKPWTRTLAVAATAVLLVMATVCIARIALTNLTVQMMARAERVQENIDTARNVGLSLEVKHSLATNPNRIQNAATALSMVPDGAVQTLPARGEFSSEVQSQMATAASAQLAAILAEAEAAAAARQAEAEAAQRETEAGATEAEVDATEAGISQEAKMMSGTGAAAAGAEEAAMPGAVGAARPAA
ncbi:MAG: hypothetical protein LBU07_02350 [Coriobacteriales bacterium]|jgi:hypothetical protein|nr:hypothetical protein [Coriobacteriales bacterium]